jgi:hypothetical protein
VHGGEHHHGADDGSRPVGDGEPSHLDACGERGGDFHLDGDASYHPGGDDG